MFSKGKEILFSPIRQAVTYRQAVMSRPSNSSASAIETLHAVKIDSSFDSFPPLPKIEKVEKREAERASSRVTQSNHKVSVQTKVETKDMMSAKVNSETRKDVKQGALMAHRNLGPNSATMVSAKSLNYYESVPDSFILALSNEMSKQEDSALRANTLDQFSFSFSFFFLFFFPETATLKVKA